MADDNAKELVKRGEKLFSARLGIESLWQTLAANFYPERADFTTERSWNEEFAADLFDSSPILARRDLGNSFGAMLRPRGQQWFKGALEDDDRAEAPGVSEFMDMVTRTMWKALYAREAQFVRATKEGDHDFATFGQAVLSAEADGNRAGLRFRCHHLRDCAWAENADGAVDTMFRTFHWTARQMRQRWGEKRLSDKVKKALEKDQDKSFKLQHVMLPAVDYEYAGSKRQLKGADYVSVYIEVDGKHIISEAPSYEFRYVVPRWQTVSGSPYAVSPAAMISLPDARMMQSMARVMLEAGEKSVDPPLLAKNDAIPGEINLYASGTTWVDADYDYRLGKPVIPLELGKNIRLGVELLNRTQAMIKEAWYLNKLNLPQQGARTAFETARLVEEFIRAAIPLFEPMETTYNAALLDEAFAILARNGAFGNPDDWPDALFDDNGRSIADIGFTFSNPLQDAIEKNKAMQFQGALGLLGAAAKFDPTVRHDFNVREGFRDAVKGSGAAAKWLPGKEDADEAAEAERQSMQDAQAANEIGTAGAVAEQVGKGGAALAQMMQ